MTRRDVSTGLLPGGGGWRIGHGTDDIVRCHRHVVTGGMPLMEGSSGAI